MFKGPTKCHTVIFEGVIAIKSCEGSFFLFVGSFFSISRSPGRTLRNSKGVSNKPPVLPSTKLKYLWYVWSGFFFYVTTKFRFYKVYIHLLSPGSYMHLKSCRIHFILFLVNIKMYLLSIWYLQSAHLCDSEHAMNPDDDNNVITIK